MLSNQQIDKLRFDISRSGALHNWFNEYYNTSRDLRMDRITTRWNQIFDEV